MTGCSDYRVVDSADVDAFRMMVVQNFEGFAVEDGDTGARPSRAAHLLRICHSFPRRHRLRIGPQTAEQPISNCLRIMKQKTQSRSGICA